MYQTNAGPVTLPTDTSRNGFPQVLKHLTPFSDVKVDLKFESDMGDKAVYRGPDNQRFLVSKKGEGWSIVCADAHHR